MDKLMPDELRDRVTVFDVDELTLWEDNPNEGDMGAIHVSMEEFGDLLPILVTTDEHGRHLVIDGNHRVMVERQARRFEGKLAGVDITGLQWSEVKALAAGLTMNSSARAGRDDPTLMAAALINIRDHDARLLQAMSVTDEDIEALLGQSTAPKGTLLKLLDVCMDDPKHQPEDGSVWQLGRHTLIVADVMTGWPQWSPYLTADALFVPYPGPFVPLCLKAESVTMILVQPEPYLAGHLLDKWASIYGEPELKSTLITGDE